MNDCKACMRCRVCGKSVEFESQIAACHWCWTRKEVRDSLNFGLFAGVVIGLCLGLIALKVLFG